MEFYDYDISYNKSMKKKLFISMGIIVTAVIFFITVYIFKPSIISGANKNNDNKSVNIAEGTKEPIENISLDGLAQESIEESSEEITEDESNNNEEEQEKSETSENETSAESTKKPETTKEPSNIENKAKTENDIKINKTKNKTETVKATPKPTQTPIATPKPTVKPTKRPSGNSTEHVANGDLSAQEGRGMYIENPGTLVCRFTGTPNAYLYGYLTYTSTDGSRVSDYWSITLNSSGTGQLSLPLKSNVHQYSFNIASITLNGVSSSSLSCDVTLQNVRN